ncbi:thermonuclease family protein [Bradyrhizobium sp. CCGUVB14]|uniref:thermonuclease family protein n=1 Tax=Bradyrhizobium sp. CCGUVB14 TaxID=2949628 RepID=UPI0020B2BFB6|nr:thermonuclease family protein [Bradyrhizobium sp. CCGUVB14]MCP3447350.1 thermonuclease family protein [Bradyrhizobium sp. CCGUVB14]
MAFLILASLVALAVPACGGDLAGRASVIDGDTIEVHGTRIRLFGIDAPEAAQLCRDGQGKDYRCGQRAANALADLIDGKLVACDPRGPDQYGRTVAVCAVSGLDIGEWLVRRGLAIDYAYYSKGRYRAAQDEASKARTGVWAGDFIEPRYFRSCMKSGRLPSDCSSP